MEMLTKDALVLRQEKNVGRQIVGAIQRQTTLISILLTFCLTAPASAEPVNKYAASFDIVWDTMNERFYDSEFNGIDWPQSRERYRPMVVDAENDETFYQHINTRLFELGVSHLGVIRTDDIEELGAATIFGEGTVGIDVRLVEGKLFITELEEGSAAADAGLLAGYEVLCLNCRTIEEIVAERLAYPTPPFTERNHRYMVLEDVYWELLGSIQGEVIIGFKDHDDNVSERLLKRRSRGAATVFDEALPPTYLTFKSERIGEDVGYIKFNNFHPELLDDLASAMGVHADTKGLIIDLRGNPGGAFGVRHQLAGRFVTERSLIWHYRGKRGIDDIYLEPAERPYTGELVILVDGFSASSSEDVFRWPSIHGASDNCWCADPRKGPRGGYCRAPCWRLFFLSSGRNNNVYWDRAGTSRSDTGCRSSLYPGRPERRT